MASRPMMRYGSLFCKDLVDDLWIYLGVKIGEKGMMGCWGVRICDTVRGTSAVCVLGFGGMLAPVGLMTVGGLQIPDELVPDCKSGTAGVVICFY